MAMQLALCLLIGLRLVSASLQGSTCILRQRLSLYTQQCPQDQRRIAPPVQRWGVDVLVDSNSEFQTGPRNATADTIFGSTSRDTPGVKRSLSSSKIDCEPSHRGSHKQSGGIDPSCQQQVYGDYTSTSPSGSTSAEDSSDNNSGSGPLHPPLATLRPLQSLVQTRIATLSLHLHRTTTTPWTFSLIAF